MTTPEPAREPGPGAARSARIQVTFPVLNEEEQLASSVERSLAFCRDHGVTIHEFCIADNGSTDRTEEIGRALAARYPNVRYRRLPVRGFGLALKTAWGESDADYVGYMDIDLATDLRHLKEVHDHVVRGAPYQLYLGSRLLPGASVRNRKLVRGLTSRVFNRLLRLRLGVSFTDAMCGFKFIDRALYQTLCDRFTFTDDWFFATQVAVRAEWLGAKVLDMPVQWTDDPDNSTSGARLVNLARLYLAGISDLRQEMRQLQRAKPPARR
jgi:glycosyltransferase involved in cell wall biosynthesis